MRSHLNNNQQKVNECTGLYIKILHITAEILHNKKTHKSIKQTLLNSSLICGDTSQSELFGPSYLLHNNRNINDTHFTAIIKV